MTNLPHHLLLVKIPAVTAQIPNSVLQFSGMSWNLVSATDSELWAGELQAGKSYFLKDSLKKIVYF